MGTWKTPCSGCIEPTKEKTKKGRVQDGHLQKQHNQENESSSKPSYLYRTNEQCIKQNNLIYTYNSFASELSV
jgi:hypothetical protein